MASSSNDRHFKYKCQIPTCLVKLRWAEYRIHLGNEHGIWDPRDFALITYRSRNGTRRQRCVACGREGPNQSMRKHWEDGCTGPAVPRSSNGQYDDRLNAFSFSYPGTKPPILKSGEAPPDTIIPFFEQDLLELFDIRKKYEEIMNKNNESTLGPATTEAASDIDSDINEESKKETTIAQDNITETESELESEALSKPQPANKIEMIPAKSVQAIERPALQVDSGFSMEIVKSVPKQELETVVLATSEIIQEKSKLQASIVASCEITSIVQTKVNDDHLLLLWENTNANQGYVKQFNSMLKKRQRFDELSEETYDVLENFRARDLMRFPKLRFLGGYQ